MPPRRAPRNSRMHAAIDNMRVFGFDARLVERTVKSLLKEYGGAEGWVFIEEYNYKVLLERILEDQEEEEKKKNQIETSKEVDTDEHFSLEARNEAGPSCLPGLEDAATETTTTESGVNRMQMSAISSDPPPPPPPPPRAAAEPLSNGGQEPLKTSSPASSNSVPRPRRRRKPCYGWIGEGEDDDNMEFVLLPALKPNQEPV